AFRVGRASVARMRKPLPMKRLVERLSYDAETGVLTWRPRPREEFTERRHQLCWNARYAGKAAGCETAGNYQAVAIDGIIYLAHRIAWAIATGEDPASNDIDHINGDGLDNRLANLRSVSHSINHRNRRLQSNNKSGHTGVFWNKWKSC